MYKHFDILLASVGTKLKPIQKMVKSKKMVGTLNVYRRGNRIASGQDWPRSGTKSSRIGQIDLKMD